MKTLYILIITFFLSFSSALSAQEEVEIINCYGPSLSELYTLLDSELVIYGSIILNDGPFAHYKIEAILQQKGRWFEIGDTISIFLDDQFTQNFYLKTSAYKRARIALMIGKKHWELKSSSRFSYETLGEKNLIDMIDRVIELPTNPYESALVLRDFLAAYTVKFSDVISADCKLQPSALSKLRKINPLVDQFEKQGRKLISEIDLVLEEPQYQIGSSNINIDTIPKAIFEPLIQDSRATVNDLIHISNFSPDDDEYINYRIRVYIKIYIDEVGKVYKTELLHGLRSDYDAYAMKIAAASGPWKPFEQNGVYRKGYFSLPFNFLPRDEK
jgi:hypothetical protein